MRLLWITVLFFLGYLLSKRLRHEKKIETFMEFIHIPKNAGSTIEHLAIEKDIRWGRFKPEHRDFLDEYACSYWHVPPKHFKSGNFYQNSEDNFCVIRNPLSRIISEYAYQHSNEHHKNNANDLNEWIEKVLTDNDLDTSFQGGSDCHLLPQHNYIYDDLNDVQTCTHLLRFEHLEEDFNDLMKKEKYDLKLSKKDNVSKFDLTEADITAANKARIRKIYARDFELWYKNKDKRT